MTTKPRRSPKVIAARQDRRALLAAELAAIRDYKKHLAQILPDVLDELAEREADVFDGIADMVLSEPRQVTQ